MKLTFVHPDGSSTQVDGETGDSLMIAATSNEVPGIVGDCGGGMTCATCHVFIADEWTEQIGPAGLEEAALLGTTAVLASERSRLSCQVLLDDDRDGLVVRVPEEQWS